MRSRGTKKRRGARADVARPIEFQRQLYTTISYAGGLCTTAGMLSKDILGTLYFCQNTLEMYFEMEFFGTGAREPRNRQRYLEQELVVVYALYRKLQVFR